MGDIFSFINPRSYDDVLELAKHKSKAVKEIWLVSASITLIELWFIRNKIGFEKAVPNMDAIKGRFLAFRKECDIRMKEGMCNRLCQVVWR